jgi:hypothetical protein
MTLLKDATGTGNGTKVDSTNRLRTRTVSDTSAVEAIQAGRSFFVSTGIVTLCSTCASQLLYLKNCDDRDIFITQLVQVFGASTCGTGDYQANLYVNATTGTLICCGACGIVINSNTGSGLTADVTVKVGAEGSTVVGFAATDLHPESTRVEINDLAIIPKGGSVAFGIIPPTGNMSMRTQIGLTFYFIEET